MKIAYLSTFYPFRGGIAQFNASLFNEFSKNNDIKSYTFSLQYPKILFPGTTQLVQDSDIVTKIDSRQILNTLNPLSYIKTAKSILNEKPELLLTKFWMPYFAPSLGYVAGKVRKNAVAVSILDNVIPHELRYGDISLIKYFLNRNDGFIVMSEAVRNDLLELKPDAKYLFHQHPLYNHFGNTIMKREARTILGLPLDKKILLCFGFIRDYKGLDLAIQALQKLDNSYHLVIAGEVYGSFDKYQKLIDDLNLNSRISVFSHYISDEQTSVFFSSADICLLPYKSATQSGIVAISYHFELPVIATRVGGLAEMIEPFGSGIMVNEINSDSIAKSIKEFEAYNQNEVVANIQNYKKLASWYSLANSIINFAKDLKK
jgi:glycosyltransferase involved in cell wall biosynthesis